MGGISKDCVWRYQEWDGVILLASRDSSSLKAFGPSVNSTAKWSPQTNRVCSLARLFMRNILRFTSCENISSVVKNSKQTFKGLFEENMRKY